MDTSRNICKFVVTPAKDTLLTENFVLESEASETEEMAAVPFHRVCLVISGKGYCHTRQQRVSIGKGDLFFQLAGVAGCVENENNLQYMYISFSGHRADVLFERFGISSFTGVLSGYEGLIPLWRESLTRADQETIDLLSESVLLHTFSLLRQQGRQGGALFQVLQYIEHHFADCDLTLSSVSAQLHYNSKYLSHLFKRKLGISFSEYIREVRLRHAVLLLEQGLTSVKNIALLSGYTDPLYFSRVFRQALGISPRAYIEKQMQQSDTTQS